jgi:HEAT repeat protein/putative zinc finger protein
MNVNCKDYQRQISLLLYDELAEGARQALETHLLSCEECKDAFAAERTMHSVLADDTAGWDVPSDLLVESRKALADELDHIERKRSWWKVPTFSVVFTPMRLLESAALIAMGLALGVYVSNQQVRRADPNAGQTQDVASTLPRDGAISNLQVVNADPITGQVELAGEVSRPLRFQGRMDDAAIRQILFSALRDPHNPGSRLKAVEVLSQKPTDESIEEALITALIYDDDAGVRMRALEGLKTYANEKHVLAAFMHTLQNDENGGIRIAAIDALLARNPKDSQFAEKLTEATKKDDNPYIRSKVDGLQFVGNTK